MSATERERGTQEESEATYHAVVELMRSGMPSAKAAIAAHAEATGMPEGKVQGRYYSSKARLDPGSSTRPAKAAEASQREQKTASNGNGKTASAMLAEVADLLAQAADTVRATAADVQRLEDDAAQWRTVAAMMQRTLDPSR